MSKPALTYQEQLDLLKKRGLLVPNELFALHALAHHNYYRLSVYRLFFTQPGDPNSFKPGITFTQLWDLYHFDRTLRQLVLEGGKRVEISIRSRLAYEIGHLFDPLAYLDPLNFSATFNHADTLTRLRAEMDRSREEFIRHRQKKLGMPWPPIWVIAEVASFGTVARLLAGLKSSAIRQRVADTYQLDEKTLCSFVLHLSVLRNMAAHHGRLWNRKFTFTMQIPRKKPPHLFPNFNVTSSPLGNPKERKIYNSLVLLVHLVQIIEPQSDWPHRLATHLNTLDPALQPEMELPPGWQSRPLWHPII